MSDTRDLASVLAAAERAAAAGDFPAAEARLREAARRQEAELGPRHPELAHTLNNLGVACERVGKRADAEHCYRRARDIAAAALPADHPFVLTSERNLREFLEAHRLPIETPIPSPAAASGPALPEQPARTRGPGRAIGPRERADAPAPPATKRSAPGRLAPAGAQVPASASTGADGQARQAGRTLVPHGSIGRAAKVAAGAVALALLLVVAARWGLRSHGPAGPASAPSAAGAPAPPAAGTGAPARGDVVGGSRTSGSAAAGTAVPPDASLAAPVERLERPGGRTAGPGEKRRSPGEGAAAFSGRRAPASARADGSGAAGSLAGTARPPVGPPDAVSPPPRPTRRAAPSDPRERRPGPPPSARPALSEARLCRSLAPAAGWRCEPAAKPARSGPLFFYTRVRAARATTVYHHWYAGGRLRQAVALRIGAGGPEGFRTYSRARVFPVAGGWRVELRAQDGTLLYEERFGVR